MKKFLKIGLIVLLVLIAAILFYLVYATTTYYRIDDNQKLAVEGGGKAEKIQLSQNYKAVSYNIGYGAYSRDYTFFMDGGKESKGRSAEEVTRNIEGAIEVVKKLKPDFVLFQEVDIKADRSYDINQDEMITKAFPKMSKMVAQNYDSPYLFYPFTDPIGKSKAEIMTLSQMKMKSGIRRSLPISEGFGKYLDLDRCYMVSSYKVENGKTLYIYNVHLSAYGADESVRDKQMKMLFDDMNEKVENGDYVICGGDFNHDFTGYSVEYFNGENTPTTEWAQPFPETFLGNNFKRAIEYKGQNIVPTGRNNDIPYQPGVSKVFILDGFIYSKNVSMERVRNIDTDFEYTDHMPVELVFKLNL